MENLDGTILVVAAPSIARDFGVTSASISVAITAYLLVVAVLIPLSGWLSNRFGARRIFAIAILVFTVASVLCALSSSLPMLVVMRVLQGVGGALMVPVGRLTVLRVTPKRDLIRAIALLTWPALVAPIAAPFLGGLLTSFATWHWIFLINVPFGIVAFILAVRIMPALEETDQLAFDWLGLALSSFGLGALVYASALVSRAGFDIAQFAVVLGLGIVLLGLAVRHLLRAPRPFVDLRILKIETFRISNYGGSIYRLTINAVPFLLPLLFQDAFGWSPIQAGSVVLFLFVGNLAIKPATTWMLRRFGFRLVLIAANLAGIACMLAMAFLTAATPIVLTVCILFLSGVARSVGFTAYNTVGYADLEPAQMTGANVLGSTLQQVAAGFGVAVAGIALTIGYALIGTVPSDAAGVIAPEFPYQLAFFVIAALTIIPTVEAWLVSRTAGQTITAR
jgi:EmrB/QacA subfamily drug resistance transporter